MTKTSLILATAGLMGLIIACNKGKNNPESCNGENTRRAIKICVDDDTPTIDTIPVVTDVISFGQIEVPEADKESPRLAAEKQVYTITAKVHKLSKHRDGDWKVKLTDGNDHFVNCEAPNMGCKYIEGSIFYGQMNTARQWIESNKDDLVGKTVTITGVGFIDIDHKYPRNAAENEMELHPILEISY